jgi:hypothetical protein
MTKLLLTRAAQVGKPACSSVSIRPAVHSKSSVADAEVVTVRVNLDAMAGTIQPAVQEEFGKVTD